MRPILAPGRTWFRLADAVAAITLAVMDRRARRRRR